MIADASILAGSPAICTGNSSFCAQQRIVGEYSTNLKYLCFLCIPRVLVALKPLSVTER